MEQTYFFPEKSTTEYTPADKDVCQNKECKHEKVV